MNYQKLIEEHIKKVESFLVALNIRYRYKSSIINTFTTGINNEYNRIKDYNEDVIVMILYNYRCSFIAKITNLETDAHYISALINKCKKLNLNHNTIPIDKKLYDNSNKINIIISIIICNYDFDSSKIIANLERTLRAQTLYNISNDSYVDSDDNDINKIIKSIE